MFVRMNTITGAKNIDAGVDYIRDNVISEVQGQKGFRGMTVSGNRSTGEFGILSQWDTLADLEASESTVSKARQEAVKLIGGEITVTILEQMVAEIVAPQDLVGHPLRIVQVKMDPAKVDEHVAFFQSDLVPELKATQGFVAVRNMVNRSTGEGTVGTIWADEQSMQAAEPKAEERRKRVSARGIEISDPRYRTVLFNHLV